MEARARVTSKGQVTVPVEVRRGLGIEEGDVLIFELADAYATIRRRRPTLEVAQEVRQRYLAGRQPRPVTNREAIEEHIASDTDADTSDTVLVSAGDGTFGDAGAPGSGLDDASR